MPALYGGTISLANVFLGAPVGDWVDRNERLYVVQRSLLIANGSVVFAVIVIGALLSHEGIVAVVGNVYTQERKRASARARSQDKERQGMCVFVCVGVCSCADLASPHLDTFSSCISSPRYL